MIEARAFQKSQRLVAAIEIIPLRDLPLFAPGLNISGEIAIAARRQAISIAAGDVVVVAQKIVSKVEGRMVRLRDVTAAAEAVTLAARCRRDAALVQLILDESLEILRATPGVIIARHRTGHVLANAGIDASNVAGGAEDNVLLWPCDPDASARAIRAGLRVEFGVAPAVVIADSMGRAWRLGTMGTAIGCAGLTVNDDRRGEVDLFGRVLQATIVGVADSIAAAAVLAMGEGAEGVPAVIMRGLAHYTVEPDGPGAASAIRPAAEDLFR